MSLEPSLNVFSMMNADIVTDDMDHLDANWNRLVEIVQKSDEFALTLAWVTLPVEAAGARVESGQQVQGTVALVFMFDPVRYVAWLCWLGVVKTGSRLKRGLFIEAQDDFVLAQRAGIELDELGYTAIENLIARPVRIEPHVMAPGFELVGGQNAPDGLRRNGCNTALLHQGTSPFDTIPL
jgi:hypothetical protein